MKQFVRVTLFRKTYTKDGAGGETATLAPLSVVQGELRLRQRINQQYNRVEVTPMGGSPGVTTVETPFLIFREPFPEVEIGDVAQMPDGRQFTVFFVRQYERTMQCDLNRVE